MAELSVNFSKLDQVIRDLQTIEDNFDDRIDLLNDIKNQVNGTTDEFGYLSSASFQLSCKINELTGYQSGVREFRDKVQTFRDTAYDEESGLANRLYTNSYDFMQEMGITPVYEQSLLERGANTIIGIVNSITSGDFSGAWDLIVDSYQGVVDWFEEHPAVGQILRVAGDAIILTGEILGLAACIVALPFTEGVSAIGIVGFAWAIIDTGTRYIADIGALGAYLSGNEELGDYINEIDMRWIFTEGARIQGNWLNDMTGWDHFDELLVLNAQLEYTTINTAAMICRLCSPAAEGEVAYEVLNILSNVVGPVGSVVYDFPEHGFGSLGHLAEIPINVLGGDGALETIQAIPSTASDLWNDFHDDGFIPDNVYEPVNYFIDGASDFTNFDFPGAIDNTINGITSAWDVLTH